MSKGPASLLFLIALLSQRAATPKPADQKVVTVRAGESLQTALDRAPAGATIQLIAGATYTGNVTIRKPVTLTTQGADLGMRRATPADAPQLAQLTSGNNGPTLDILPGVDGVNVSKMHFLIGSANDGVLIGHNDTSQTMKEQQPKNVTFDQVVIEGAAAGNAKRGISAHGVNITIKRSTIRDIKRSGQDTQAIWIVNGEGPYTVSDNYLEAAGENLMVGGDTPRIGGLIPADILIEGNDFNKPIEWKAERWTIKNLLELKAGRNVIVKGNTLSGCWAGQGQSGFAIMLTPQGETTIVVENVTIEKNVVKSVGGGINIIGTAQIGASRQTNRISIRDNWFQIDKTAYGGNGWPLFVSRGPKDLTVEYNTIETNGNQIVYQEGAPITGFTFVRNLVPKSGAYGFTGKAADGSNQHRAVKIGEYFPNARIVENAFGSFPSPANLPGNTFLASSAITLSDGYGSGAVAGFGRRR